MRKIPCGQAQRSENGGHGWVKRRGKFLEEVCAYAWFMEENGDEK